MHIEFTTDIYCIYFLKYYLLVLIFCNLCFKYLFYNFYVLLYKNITYIFILIVLFGLVTSALSAFLLAQV